MSARVEVVVVGLCTFGRPVMLRRCLDSLSAQVPPVDITFEIIVVDNEAEPNNRGHVGAFAETCRFPVHYVHQPKRGIAAARNAILDKATALGADWIAMLDDDETAAPDWIAQLMAPGYKDIPVVVGLRRFMYPDPAPFWASGKGDGPEKKIKNAHKLLSYASTSNVRFSADLLRAGLRFDESLGFLPTEDWRFFNHAHRLGFEIRMNPAAITEEWVHPERLTYRAQYLKNHGHFAAVKRNEIMDRGPRSILADLPAIGSDVLLGTIEILLSPFAAPFGLNRFKRWVLSGSRKFARVTGTIAAITGNLPQPYKTVVGH